MAENLSKQKLQQDFEQIRDERRKSANTAERIGNAFLSLLHFNTEVEDKRYLSREHDDTAGGLITFANGLVSKVLAKLASLFVSGDSQLGENDTKTTFGDFKADATGASISVDKDGTSTAEFDFLNIRRAAYFREITIKELKHVGGELALSAAAMVCSKVEWLNVRGRVITAGTPAYYKCYFETTDGKRHIYQEFAVGDQARCQQFRIESGNVAFASTKYYWRLVTGVGDNYIILSNQIGKFDGEGIPEVGDNIVQLGFQGGGNPIRTSAIILSATASDAPSTKYYQGITSFSLQDCEVKDEGFEGGQFHSCIYGTYYVGDREQTNFIAYDPLTKTATFKGKAIFEPGTTLPDGTPIEQLQGLGIKSGNLLLNSGFTGDYTSKEFDEQTEITDETTIFSDSAKYWECKNTEFIENTESASGHAATLTDGGLAQQLTASLVAGEKYTLSLKARGSSLRFTVGGYSESIQLTDELRRYSVIFECSDAEDTHFRIFEATATVMEVTLNQGNIPIQWSAAYDDNDHAMADFEAFRYLTSAITEAKTTVNGGLVMTQDIRVGQYRNGKMTKETGGMSGYAATGNSPFIWGGGDMRQAFYTIGKYINDPGYQATDEELKNMCNFVLTHGGRAILNDIILHGYIYAKGGVLQSVRSPNGNFSIDEQGNVKLKGKIEASGGTIGGFEIGKSYLWSGDYEQWAQKDILNMAQLGWNFLRIAQANAYGTDMELSHMKIGIGENSDPNPEYEGGEEVWGASAFYIYRRMNASFNGNLYIPAAKIISDNVANRNIALRTVGGLQVHGGIMETGQYITDKSGYNSIDVSKGTNIIVRNTNGDQEMSLYIPTYDDIRNQIGISDTTPFSIIIRVICALGSASVRLYNSAEAPNAIISEDSAGRFWDENGNVMAAQFRGMTQGDSFMFALIYTPDIGYYAQIINHYS